MATGLWRMKYDELAFVNQQLATMLREGIPLEGSLRQLCATMQKGRLRAELQLLENNASQLVKEEKDLVRAGVASITDYLNSIKNYRSVHQNLRKYEIRILQLQNEINFWNQ